MTQVGDPIAAGHYARHQIFAPDPLIGWSHRQRFRTALRLAQPFAGGRVLDYGSGDGTFLALLDVSGAAPALAVGAEVDPRLVLDCKERFAAHRRVRFVDVAELLALSPGPYDAVFCMEVLEHVPDPEPLLADFADLLRPGGTLLISVPIETGVPVFVKQIVRRVAGWRRIGNYPGTTDYRPRELVRSVFATSRQHLVRPEFAGADGRTFHDHKGFNWRVLQAVVASKFELRRTVTSPFNWPGPQFATQVWFVARKRSSGDQ